MFALLDRNKEKQSSGNMIKKPGRKERKVMKLPKFDYYLEAAKAIDSANSLSSRKWVIALQGRRILHVLNSTKVNNRISHFVLWPDSWELKSNLNDFGLLSKYRLVLQNAN
ncbi:MAG: hypothetical protein M1829_001986 [Trizodia sp. TS-e1964]|nr:MAG: hypothetical protein M1829_001986 [Trizodia sp. TS-e1964]